MKIVYFAWVRERVGKAEEDVNLPPHVVTVEQLIAWLTARGDEYAYAFANPGVVRVALDRKHVKHDAVIGTAREVAFFPPMTGG